MIRFWAKVKKGAANDCWPWTAWRKPNGYGWFVIKRKGDKRDITSAHRMAWRLARGTIPKGLMVLHRCDNRRCVNPKHLFLGTAKDNVRDMFQKGRNPPRHGAYSASKLTAETVARIRSMIPFKRGDVTALHRELKVSRNHIYNIALNRTWRTA